ncbi:MAG: alpha/beta fold hydrolase [Pseudomonadota bacterium]
MTSIRTLLIGCALLYFAAVAGMYVFQRELQYFPSNNNPDPSSLGLSIVTVEYLATRDGESLVVWHAPASEGQPTMLFFQGNGGEIADRANRLRAYTEAGFGVAFLSWRGYGGSTGVPSETGLLIDAHTAYDWLIARNTPPEKIVVVGESLGTGVAVQIAAEREIKALILGAPYSAAVDIAAKRYPWLPVRLLMKDQFRSIDHIPAITAPILILHGTEDRVIPFASGQRLYDATTAATIFATLEGKGHEALFEPATWAQEIEFTQNVLATSW